MKKITFTSVFIFSIYFFLSQIVYPASFDLVTVMDGPDDNTVHFADEEYIYSGMHTNNWGLYIWDRSTFTMHTCLSGIAYGPVNALADVNYIYWQTLNQIIVINRQDFSFNGYLYEWGIVESIYLYDGNLYSSHYYGETPVTIFDCSTLSEVTKLGCYPCAEVGYCSADSEYIYAKGQYEMTYVWAQADYNLHTIIPDSIPYHHTNIFTDDGYIYIDKRVWSRTDFSFYTELDIGVRYVTNNYIYGYKSNDIYVLGKPDFNLCTAIPIGGSISNIFVDEQNIFASSGTKIFVYEAPPPILTPSSTPTPSITPSTTPFYILIDSGDYDGDGKADIAIFRPDTSLWAVRGLGRVYFGTKGDIPVSGDYNGNGYTDISIFRPLSGLWAIKNISRLYFGSSGDIPVPDDYNGDGVCDIGIFDANSGLWNIKNITLIYYGNSGDQPVPADYDGDGSADIGIFRPSSGLWAIRSVTRVYFGASGDIPVPRVYKWYGMLKAIGQFRSQIAVFRPSTGLWAIRGYTRIYYGASGDIPVPADFDGNSIANIGVFRPSSGLWGIRGLSRIYFGKPGDLPVAK